MAKINMEKLMQDVVSINNQLTGLKLLLENKKKILAKYFDSTGERQLQNDEATAFVQERTTIEYDIDSLQECIDKDLLAQFIEKKYFVKSWSTFAAFCKSKGISAKEIKNYFYVEKKIDQAKLSKLYELGKIDADDLAGCYTATTKKSIVLRMKNVNTDIPITHEK